MIEAAEETVADRVAAVKGTRVAEAITIKSVGEKWYIS